MKKTISLTALLLASATLHAQDTDHPSWLHTAQVEARIDWQRDYIDGEKTEGNSGFKGKYINLILKGNLSPKVSYAYRQRFSKSFSSSGLFDATDWLYVAYAPNEKWVLSGGKQTVALGGYEWDYAPIDIYQYSEYCNHVACYQFGVSAAYNLNTDNQLVFQICQSPFHGSHDIYAYNLKWAGTHGAYSNIWSASMMEYLPGKYINYLILGNRFDFKGGHLLFDITNRYSGGFDAGFMDDFTITTELHVQPTKELNIFAKYGYDKNKKNGGDYLVWANTEMHHAGVGLEYFPLDGSNKLRLHANVFHNWGKNGHPDPILQDKQNTVDVGVTLRADLLNVKKNKN